MTLYDAIASELPFLREQAESLMTDTCVLKRKTGETEQNETTGSVEPVMTELFTSPCKIQSRALVATDAEVGGHTRTTVRLELHLPVSADELQTDDEATITAAGPLSDPQLVGRVFRIVGPVGKSFQTARRFEVEEVVR